MIVFIIEADFKFELVFEFVKQKIIVMKKVSNPSRKF
jgi:hypothetical protein